MKYQIPLMLNNGGGAIVNTSTAAGVKGFKGIASYVAAKHGIVGLTKAAALDYADANLRINVVCPGNIDTPMMDRFTGGTEDSTRPGQASWTQSRRCSIFGECTTCTLSRFPCFPGLADGRSALI